VHERWAQLRFSVIGHLLAAPPAKGALRAALEQLAAREWRHPSTGDRSASAFPPWSDGSTAPAMSGMTR
jgi:hypothetical protein